MMTETTEGGFDYPAQGSVDSPITPISVESCAATENDQLMTGKGAKQMALYEDDEEERPLVSRVIYRLANYEGGIVPNVEQETGDEAELPEEEGTTGSKKRKKKIKKTGKKKLGTVLGVYFPCIQNIFGVILFIRLVWVVGTAGWIEAFIIALMCCCCTMTTSISMSAIATNGVVPGGGSYFMISRSLGPEFGGAVGILFYLGTTVASSMYIVGAVEILLQYMAPPQAALFGPINIPDNAYNCYRVYGTCLLLVMFTCVFIGVKFVSKLSPIALFCVIFSIICVYIGIFVANPDRGPKICFLGERLLSMEKIVDENGTMQCHKFPNGTIYHLYCPNVTDMYETTDPDCIYFRDHETWIKPGIPGIKSGKFYENAWRHYTEEGNRIGTDQPGDRKKGDILTDITTSFVVLIGIFFPSVTGIMAGSNRSGDLADAQKSIPVGTIGAVATTSIVYLSTLLLFGACVEGQFMRDKIGESMGGGLIVAQMAWPNPWVIMVGSFLSTCGAGLQSLVGAPRLLQAIAADGVIPFLNGFAVTNKNGEPRRALYLTAAIAESGVLLANVDYIAPIITMFFLMCYCFTNLACAVQTILKTPNWRPRFRFYHWALSLFGVCLCLSLMFMASWYYAIAALGLAAGIYKYIEYKGAEKEWGDGIRGLAMSAARFALLRLEEGPPHVKNWRPQLLILLKTGENMEPKYRKLLTFSSQLKAGKGLTLVASVLEGDHHDRRPDGEVAKHNITEMMKRERVKGFAEVVISRNVGDGVSYLIQGAGVGGLRHNSILMNWPQKWRKENKSNQSIIDIMRIAADRQLAVMIVKGINQFPENGDRLGGTIDIWWIVHEGGLLMLLPFLLTQGKVWRKCKMRIFTVAQMEDNSIQIKKDMEKFLYHLRIPAQVKVVEMPTSDISAYTYERTLMMEQRTALLEKMHIKRSSLAPQMIVDQAHPHHVYHLSPRHQQTHQQQQQHQQPHPETLHPGADAVAIDMHKLETEAAGGGCGAIAFKKIEEMDEAEEAEEEEEKKTKAVDGEEEKQPDRVERPAQEPAADDAKDTTEAEREDAEGEDTVDQQHEDHVTPDPADGGGAASKRKSEEAVRTTEVKMKSGSDGVGSSSSCSNSEKVTPPPNYNSLAAKLIPSAQQTHGSKQEAASPGVQVPNTQNIRRMHTAIRLNQVIKEESIDAKLTIINLPGPPRDNSGEENYMDFLEALTEGLERVLMVRGGGKEVITIYS